MAARESVRITKETTWGTYQTSAPTSDVAVLHLPAGNSMTIRPRPIAWTERSAAGSNRRVLRAAEQASVGGRISTKLFPSQAKLLLPLSVTLSGTVLDLPSFTVDHKFYLDDGSAATYRRYLGCKVDKLSLKADNTPGGAVFKVDLDVIGKQPAAITNTDFPEPAFGSAPAPPTDDPYAFQDCAGQLSINGTITNFSSVSLDVDNKLRAPFDEGKYIASLRWSGRDVSFMARARYLTTSWRTILEAQTAEPITFAFTEGSNTVSFALNTANYPASVEDDLPFEGDGFYQTLMWDNFFDPTSGTVNDIAVTVTP